MLNTVQYTIENGTDKGKIFVIEKLPLFAADKWARHLIKTLAGAGEKALQSVLKHPVRDRNDLALLLFSKMALDDLERSFETILKCCKIQEPDQDKYRNIVSDDIEDPMTLANLRIKAFAFHVDFLRASYQQLLPLNVIFDLASEERT